MSTESPQADESNDVSVEGAKETVKAILALIEGATKMGKQKRAQVKAKVLQLERTFINLSQRLAEKELLVTNIGEKNPTISRSYSSVAAGRPPVQAKHMLRVFPKQTSESPVTSQATKQMVMQVSLKGLKVRVNSIKTMAKGGVTVELNNKEEVKALSDAIKKADNFEVKEPKKVNPTFTILLPGKDHNLDDIREDILTKNEFIPDTPDSVKIVPRQWFTKNGNTIVILEVAPSVYQQIAEHDFRLYVGWTSVKLRERDPVSQCFRCNRFGHKSLHCHYTVDGNEATRCAGCGGHHQEINKCEAPLNCPNCQDFNKFAKPTMKKLDTNHSARDRNCPCRQHAINKAKQQNVDYGY